MAPQNDDKKPQQTLTEELTETLSKNGEVCTEVNFTMTIPGVSIREMRLYLIGNAELVAKRCAAWQQCKTRAPLVGFVFRQSSDKPRLESYTQLPASMGPSASFTIVRTYRAAEVNLALI